jgi:hypothetical protein
MVHQSNELTEVCLADKIENAVQTWVPVARFATLDEKNPPSEMIHHRLSISRVPPLCGIIVFASRQYYPESTAKACFFNLRDPGFLY